MYSKENEAAIVFLHDGEITDNLEVKNSGAEIGAWLTINSKKHLVKIPTDIPGLIKEYVGLKIYSILTETPAAKIGFIESPMFDVIINTFLKHKNANLIRKPEEFHSLLSDVERPFFNKKRYFTITEPSLNLKNHRLHPVFLSPELATYEDFGAIFTTQLQGGEIPTTITLAEKTYSLKGFIKAAATAKMLGDIDWLGKLGTNAGNILLKDQAETVLVDAGFAFFQKYSIQQTTKDICFCSNGGIIRFDAMSPKQQEEFVCTLYFLNRLINENLVKEIFDQFKSIEQFSPIKITSIIKDITKILQNNSDVLCNPKYGVYKEELKAHGLINKKDHFLSFSLSQLFKKNTRAQTNLTPSDLRPRY